MNCTCPKCNANIDVDLSRISEKGNFTPCPECKRRFWINRESYSRMALKKEGYTYCDQCGREIDNKIVCSGCGVMYPDYCLVQTSRPPLRSVEKKNLFNISFTLKPVTPSYTYSYSYSSAEAKKTSTVATGSLLKLAGVGAIVLLLAFGVTSFYHKKKTEQQFAKNYIRALYTIKTGADLSLDICSKISTDWKANISAGQNQIPRIKEEDESRLNTVRQTSEHFMQTLNNPPKKFLESKEKLSNLYNLYLKVNTLATAPSGSLSGFTSSVANSQNDLNTGMKELKMGFTPELFAEFQIAKTKYKGFKES